MVAYLIAVLGGFSLSSNPSPLEGREVCPNSSIQLHCEVKDVTDDVLRWFASTNSTHLEDSIIYLTGFTITADVTLPQIIPLLNNIPGLEVYLTSIYFSQNEQLIIAYNSTLTVNTSLYNDSELYYISCGSFNGRSDWTSLNFSIKCKKNLIFYLSMA